MIAVSRLREGKERPVSKSEGERERGTVI